VLGSNRSPHKHPTFSHDADLSYIKKKTENDELFGYYVTFCKRYWGSQMEDYGPSRWLEADKFIDDHKLIWETQAEQDKAQGDAEGDTTEHEDLGEDGSSGEDGNDIDMLEDDPIHPSSVPSMSSSAGQNEEFSDERRLSRIMPPTTRWTFTA
jgi:hypothetical protein